MASLDSKFLPKMIGFAGYGGAGKDEMAKTLIKFGYEKRTVGDLIKSSLKPMATGCPSIDEIEKHIAKWELTSYYSKLPVIASAYYNCKLGNIDPFTSDPEEKQHLRPLLEVAGLAGYGEYFSKFFSRIPAKCVNTRICRLDEANEWRKRGGVIIEVVRRGVGPASSTEDEWMFQLKKEHLIDYTFANWGPAEESQSRFLKSLGVFLPDEDFIKHINVPYVTNVVINAMAA